MHKMGVKPRFWERLVGVWCINSHFNQNCFTGAVRGISIPCNQQKVTKWPLNYVYNPLDSFKICLLKNNHLCAILPQCAMSSLYFSQFYTLTNFSLVSNGMNGVKYVSAYLTLYLHLLKTSMLKDFQIPLIHIELLKH